jgi:hypothetical protein
MTVSLSRSKSALLVLDLQLGMFNAEGSAPISRGRKADVATAVGSDPGFRKAWRAHFCGNLATE